MTQQRCTLGLFVTSFFLYPLVTQIDGFTGSGIPGRHETEKNCTIRESCQHQHLVNNERLNLCECDEKCSLYDDCCFDAQNTFTTKLSRKQWKKVECVKENRIIMSRSIYMVKSCPQWFDNDYIKAKCEDRPTDCGEDLQHEAIENVVVNHLASAGNGPGITTQLPVTGNKSGILYKNMYCALCHEEKIFKFWKLRFLSRRAFDMNLLNDTKNLQALLVKSLRGGHQSMGFTSPEEADSYRTCTNSIDKCLINETKSNQREEPCSGATSYVFAGGKTYRNKECALCNDVPEQEIGCIDPNAYLNSGRLGRPPPSFALLLDFNLGTGKFIQRGRQRVGFLQNEEFNLSVPAECRSPRDGSPPGIYDPFTGRCIRVSCPRGYRLSCGELCIRDPLYVTSVNDGLNLPKFGRALGYLTLVGNILSILGLTIQLSVYAHLPNLRNTPGKCLMCLSSWLLVSQSVFTFGIAKSEIYALCYVMSVLLHFSFLSYFFWMNVMAYDVWHAFGNARRSMKTKNQRKNRSFIIYFLYAAIWPSIIILTSIILDQSGANIRPRYAEDFCWIGDKKGGLVLFAAPMLIIIVMNVMFFALTARNICVTSDSTSLVRKEKTRATLYMKLALIMGLTWTTGIIAMATDRIELWYIFTIVNAFQGIFICISFVCTRKVYRSLHERLSVMKRSRSTSDTKTSSIKQTQAVTDRELKQTDLNGSQDSKLLLNAGK